MKALIRSRFTWLSTLAIVPFCATVVFAVFFDSETDIEDLFDRNLYGSYMASVVSSEADLVADYEWQQVIFMPLLLPDAEHILVHSVGVRPVKDWSTFTAEFVKMLIPVERQGITYWPVYIMEDASVKPRRRLILNANGETIADLPAPSDYDPAWWINEHYDSEDILSQDELSRKLAMYDGARLVIQYDLTDAKNLTRHVLLQSIQAAESAALEESGGGQMMLMMGQASYSNLAFVAFERAPVTNGVVLTLGIPDDMTNTDVSVFACTNLVDPEWDLIGVTNTPSSTNLVEYHDEDATNYTVRFYRAHAFAGTLHPQAGDFDSGKAGRVMISTLHDDNYYTETDTTIADAPAQTEDGKVTITAHLPTFCEGDTVYFRVVTPDPDDASSYETNSIGGDNRDTNIVAGVLSASSDVAELETINGTEVAAAEVELTITDQYAGDNYQVEFSLDSDFARILDRTSIMVAWKRIYVEEDSMYVAGADLAEDFTSDADADPDSVSIVSRSINWPIGDRFSVPHSDGLF